MCFDSGLRELYPQEAQSLLAGDDCGTSSLAVRDNQALSRVLARQSQAAQRGTQATLNLLTMPSADRCGQRSNRERQRLRQCIAKPVGMPPNDASRYGTSRKGSHASGNTWAAEFCRLGCALLASEEFLAARTHDGIERTQRSNVGSPGCKFRPIIGAFPL